MQTLVWDTNISLIQSYITLNSKFLRTLVFKIGDEAGFFSEYNNMLLAMLYCLENEIRFELSSKDANFAYNTGWDDYFLPFCKENNSKFHLKYNHRSDRIFTPILRHRLKRLGIVKNVETNYPWFYAPLKRLRIMPFLTQDVFVQIRKMPIDKIYSFPALGISGDLRQSLGYLSRITWHFNSQMQIKVNDLVKSLSIPNEFVGMHIRRGDKQIESKIFEPDAYFRCLSEQKVLCKNVFILTDDYSVIDYLRTRYKDYNIYTFCKDDERGYHHNDFVDQEKSLKKDLMIRLFASIELLQESILCIGTYSSNPGMFLGIRLAPERFVGLDYNQWVLW